MRIPIDVGGDGIDYQFWLQQRDHSCLAACFCTVAWLTKGKIYSEDFARTLIEVTAAKLKRERLGVASQAAAALATPPDIRWETEGVRSKYLKQALDDQLHLKTVRVEKADVGDALKSAGRRTPCVLLLRRPDGFHGVVVANTTPTHLVVLDPAIGLVLTDKDEAELFKDYSPRRFDAASGELIPDAPSNGAILALLSVPAAL